MCAVYSPKSVISFNFKDGSLDLQELNRAWDIALEDALLDLTHDSKVSSFLIAGVRLGLQHRKISARSVAVLSGYSLSTFFRSFQSIEHFIEKGFFLVNSLVINIYRKHVNNQPLTLSEHVDLFLTICVGAYAAYPTDILQHMSDKYYGDIKKIHPHNKELSMALLMCLHKQDATIGLQIYPEELEELLAMLDGNLMQTALQRDGMLTKPHYFEFLHKILYGFLMLCCNKEVAVV